MDLAASLLIIVIIAAIAIIYENKCKHDWVDIAELKRRGSSSDTFKSITYVQKCSRCKKIRSFEIS